MGATMSRDGKPRLDVLIKSRAGLGDLATALAHASANGHDDFDPDALPERVGRARILALYRERVRQFGLDGFDYWRGRQRGRHPGDRGLVGRGRRSGVPGVGGPMSDDLARRLTGDPDATT